MALFRSLNQKCFENKGEFILMPEHAWSPRECHLSSLRDFVLRGKWLVVAKGGPVVYIGRLRLISPRHVALKPDVPRIESPSSTWPNLGRRGEWTQVGARVEEKGAGRGRRLRVSRGQSWD